MIDFTLTRFDQEFLGEVRAQALIARKYARYYDEHEDEFVPDSFPEAKDHGNPMAMFGQRGPEDTTYGVLSMLMSAGQTWGDYSVRLRRGRGGLGNAALRASGTEEQQQRWGQMTLAMAITE